MTERTFAGRPWFVYLGVAKHACCSFEFNLAWRLSEIKATLYATKVGRSMGTAVSQRTIIKVLGRFIHSAKRAVLLKAELERSVLLAIVKGGTYGSSMCSKFLINCTTKTQNNKITTLRGRKQFCETGDGVIIGRC